MAPRTLITGVGCIDRHLGRLSNKAQTIKYQYAAIPFVNHIMNLKESGNLPVPASLGGRQAGKCKPLLLIAEVEF
jgi:hypothetical protein